LLILGFGFFAYLLCTVGVRELGRELALLGWGLVPLMFGEGAALRLDVECLECELTDLGADDLGLAPG